MIQNLLCISINGSPGKILLPVLTIDQDVVEKENYFPRVKPHEENQESFS